MLLLLLADLWQLDLDDNSWDKIVPRGRGPTARSGHRMLTHENRLILFGGFSDFVRESKYYNDLFVFDIDTVMWNEVKYGASGAMRPQPRSGFQWLILPDGVNTAGTNTGGGGNKALLFGGYCKQMKHKKLYDSSKSAGGKVSDSVCCPHAYSAPGPTPLQLILFAVGSSRWN